MRTIILATILAVGFCLYSLEEEGQTEYRIDQRDNHAVATVHSIPIKK